MPRFFFDFADGQRDPDIEGVELPDIQAARYEAVKLAASHLRDNPNELFTTGMWRVELRGEARDLLSSVSVHYVQASPRPGA